MKIQTTAAFVVENAAGQFRAVVAHMPILESELDAVLPELCGSHAAAIGITFKNAVLRDTVMDALLAIGWQPVNYVFTGGLWYKAQDLLGTLGTPLGSDLAPATAQQLALLERVTTSHVFHNDRTAFRVAARKATIGECSKLIDTVLREVKHRKLMEKEGIYTYAQAA